MPGFVAAIKNGPAQRLLHNLLSERNHRPLRFEVGNWPGFDFKVGCEVDPVLTAPRNHHPPLPYGVDISADGIRAFFRADVYATSIEFAFSVNSIWPAGKWLGIICAKKKFGICVLWTTMIMPRLPVLRFRIEGFPRLPIMSLDTSFTVAELRSGDPDGPDHRNLHCKFVLPHVGVFENGPAFASRLTELIFDAIDRKLGELGFLGVILKHVTGFVRRIADEILGRLQFVQSWLNFVQTRVQSELATRVTRLFVDDPSISIKVGRVPARQTLAPEFAAPSGQRQPAIHANFDSMILDVNHDCPAGPELRLRVTVS